MVTGFFFLTFRNEATPHVLIRYYITGWPTLENSERVFFFLSPNTEKKKEPLLARLHVLPSKRRGIKNNWSSETEEGENATEYATSCLYTLTSLLRNDRPRQSLKKKSYRLMNLHGSTHNSTQLESIQHSIISWWPAARQNYLWHLLVS